MSKANKTQAIAINKLMLPLIATVGLFSTDENDLGMFKMYAGDVAHNASALEEFNKTLNAKRLHETIMYQDTMPREHFYKVLVYIEKQGLIPATECACI
jgi:hypothetical protein